MGKINVAVVGYGYWGPNLVRNFSRISNVNLVACCDLAEDNLRKINQLYPSVKTTRDYAEILNDIDIDAVVVATSAPTHYDLAKQALEHGKHVYVEKPLTLDSATSSELVDLADKKNKILMVGHLLEYHSAVRKVKSYIDSGEMGEVYYLYSQRLNLGKVRRDENALWSLAPHDISVILYLLGMEPVEVTTRGESYLRDGIEDVVFSSLHFPNGVMAHMQVSWLDPHKVRKLTIVGSKKMVVFDDMESAEKIKIYDKGVDGLESQDYKPYGEDLTLRFGDIVIPSINMKEPLRTECMHFIECIIEGKSPLSDGRDGLRVVKVLEAAQKSLKSGGMPVKIGDV
ncbi:Gfo/Idh/MocA family oxidoreductase [Candidatus Oleimmundimicrobium sp.]|uniref:Gfo/Idh/MocA family protein n=1 Tax=Candidatus Oleimmundimicrobium sp. TaxID=3060597 RepID=UPI0027241E2B|nr:Gfo/Idh/MocA family oxidoreductase [Candidatus Oleimmundimicrobium sp.]MDO8885569.1 Gfo/Idh/MocA family oxidoreductase [Candidatus Oleimmundimicrobium sp.]